MNIHKCNFHYKAMPDDIADFEIGGFHENTKIQISREQTKHFFTHQGLLYCKNSFVVVVTFNTRNSEQNLKNTI